MPVAIARLTEYYGSRLFRFVANCAVFFRPTICAIGSGLANEEVQRAVKKMPPRLYALNKVHVEILLKF